MTTSSRRDLALPETSSSSLGGSRWGLRIVRAASVLAVAAGVAACSSSDEETLGTSQEELSSSRWVLPEEVRAAGAQVRVQYDDVGGSCTGSLRSGAKALGDYLREQFGQVSSVGGYSCRKNTANTSKLSVHATGRALDVMTNDGDEIANWLVMNAQTIGVQLIIWNRTVWRANGSNEKRYGGPHPHDDHVHVEVNEEGASGQTPFFSGGARVAPGTTPTRPPTGGLPLDPNEEDVDPITGRPTPRPPTGTGTPIPIQEDPYDPYGGGNPYPGGYDPYGGQGTPVPAPTGTVPGGSAPGSVPVVPGGGTGVPTVPTAPTTAPPTAAPPAAPVTAPPESATYDAPSGAADSIGQGVRTPTKSKSKAKPTIESGCAAAPGAPPASSGAPLVALGLAALLVRRRRAR